jgi:ankyrin repeat protein
MIGKYLVLAGVLVAPMLAQQLSPATLPPSIRVTFANPPDPPPPLALEGGLPNEALYPSQKTSPPPKSDSLALGTFADLVAHRISSIKVTWSDPQRFKTHTQTQDLLNEVLSNAKSQTFGFHVWSNSDLTPCLTATVTHSAGHPGRLVLWCDDPVPANPPTQPYASNGALKWAYQDGSGRWWWAAWDYKTTLPKSMGPLEAASRPQSKSPQKETPPTIGLTVPPEQPGPDLFAALAKRDTPTLKSLLAAGADPNSRDQQGHGILHLAAEKGNLEALALLVDAHADVNATDHFETPLFYAVNTNQIAVASFLLAHGANVDGRDRTDRTPLIEAVQNDRVDMVRILLNAGADVNALDRTKISILMKASLANTQDVIPLLKKAGARYASPQEEMMAAASYGDAPRIRELLAAGTPADFDGGDGETPLMAAADKGQTVAVRALLAAGASVTAIDRAHRTALFYALKSNHRSTVDQLLAAGSDPKVRMGGGSTTLIQLATHMDDPDLARKFLAAGVDPNATTDNGSIYTALHEAATMGHLAVLNVLLAAGANPNAQTVLEGDSPLIDAARSGHADCVIALLKAGADPSFRDHRDPRTGNPDKSGKPGRTALDWAIAYNHPEIATLLQPKP